MGRNNTQYCIIVRTESEARYQPYGNGMFLYLRGEHLVSSSWSEMTRCHLITVTCIGLIGFCLCRASLGAEYSGWAVIFPIECDLQGRIPLRRASQMEKHAVNWEFSSFSFRIISNKESKKLRWATTEFCGGKRISVCNPRHIRKLPGGLIMRHVEDIPPISQALKTQ